MSVSFRVAGTWAELTADGAVAIPSTPQTGDRMYLFARWKDFSVTATVTDWTELAEFADGSTSAGNGTGSVKVGCWYRDWQSGDSDPIIDFSANPDNASAVIVIMTKEAADVWLTPVAVTAAMTNWTTTSQSVAASSTTTVLGGGVVMGLIGIRDDTATMTRPTNGIDDAGGLVTWNGNYVEAPATHHSTTTGFDGAADLGYRLVSAGAVGVTLRMTGTISAAETGAALWVAQGVEVNLTVADASHGHSAENAALTQVHGLSAADGSHAHAATSVTLTQVHEIATQSATHSHSADSLTLSQVHSLDAQDTSHAHSADSPTVAVIHHLEVQNANHAHVSDNPTVAVVHNLEVQPTSHGHSAENLLLTQEHVLVVASTTHSHTAQSPVVKVISIVFVDPGGDAVQAIGYFQTQVSGSGGIVSFDTSQKVNGIGSYKFDSDDGDSPTVAVTGVMGAARRVGAWFRYDSVPDATETATAFVEFTNEAYSGGGFYQGVVQVETTTIVGTITGSGNATFTVTTDLEPLPVDVSVGVLVGDTAADVAAKAVVALNANSSVSEHYIATSDGADLILTAKHPAINDNLNIAYTNDTCTGLTPDPVSEDTMPGQLSSANINLGSDDGTYGKARPAKNAGQGAIYGSLGFASGTSGLIPNDAAIKTVKIRYERKYDVDTSIGISRVKWRIDGVEGPDHDNTSEPLTDTVVEVDVTGDREAWGRSDLADGVFEVIAEARRGDSDTEHTQSWDYLEVEVEYFIPFSIVGPSGDGLAFEIALIPRGDGAILRLVDGDKVWYDGITVLLPDTDHRISWGHRLHDTDLVDIKLYVDAIEELSIEDAACAGGISNLVNLLHGWVGFPGENKVCWFDQLAIDDGDDLGDIGNVLSTYKGPATVNEDNWDTTGGTGAVNERPLSETNYREHAAPIEEQYQTYNLQAAAAGDIDVSGKQLVGHMGWAWAKKGGSGNPDVVRLITNGVEVNRLLAATPGLIRQAITSSIYPSNARGIGMFVSTEFATATMYECGVVVAYREPEEAPLLEFQLLAEDSITPASDDVSVENPDTYVIQSEVAEAPGATITTTIYATDSAGTPHQQAVIESTGGEESGRVVVTAPGEEVSASVEVVGGDAEVGLTRTLNVD